MFGSNKLKISDAVLEKVRVAAQILGCSIDEFAEKALSGESDKVLAKTASKEVSAKDVEDISNKLKGLGYLE